MIGNIGECLRHDIDRARKVAPTLDIDSLVPTIDQIQKRYSAIGADATIREFGKRLSEFERLVHEATEGKYWLSHSPSTIANWYVHSLKEQ